MTGRRRMVVPRPGGTVTSPAAGGKELDAAGIAEALGGYNGRSGPSRLSQLLMPRSRRSSAKLGLKDADDGKGGIIFYCFVCGKDGSKKIYQELKRRGLYSRGKGRPKNKDDDTEKDYWAGFELISPTPADAPFPPPLYNPKYQCTASGCWAYRDAAGAILSCELRFDTADGKVFQSVTWNRRIEDGYLWWGPRAVPRPPEWPLYGLDRLAARPGAPVIICEGEKSADAAEKIFVDHVAMTSMKGAGSALKSDPDYA